MSENHLEKNDPSASKIIPSSVPAFEKHFSVRELAQLWALSERTIRRIFAGEAGVICWGRDESRSKRAYKTLRIPDSVAQRVYRKLRKAS